NLHELDHASLGCDSHILHNTARSSLFALDCGRLSCLHTQPSPAHLFKGVAVAEAHPITRAHVQEDTRLRSILEEVLPGVLVLLILTVPHTVPRVHASLLFFRRTMQVDWKTRVHLWVVFCE